MVEGGKGTQGKRGKRKQRLQGQYAAIRKGADATVLAVAKVRNWVLLTDDDRVGNG